MHNRLFPTTKLSTSFLQKKLKGDVLESPSCRAYLTTHLEQIQSTGNLVQLWTCESLSLILIGVRWSYLSFQDIFSSSLFNMHSVEGTAPRFMNQGTSRKTVSVAATHSGVDLEQGVHGQDCQAIAGFQKAHDYSVAKN